MPTKNFICTSLSVSTTHTAVVFDPVDQRMMVKAQWNPALLDTTLATMDSELQAIYGGDATVDTNVVRFIGVSTTGEAVWAIAVAATDSASAEFRNYFKVMAYSNTVARTIASLNQSITKKAGENFAQPAYLLGYEHEKAYFIGYNSGAAPNLRVYEASSGGVTLATCSAATAALPTVPGMAYASEPYLAFGALSSGNQAGYLLRKVSGVWGQVATVAGTSPTLFPMSLIDSMAAAVGITPSRVLAYGSISETVPVPQAKDSAGSFKLDGATLTNVGTGEVINLQTAFNTAVGGTAVVDKTRQAFTYANFPTPAFWQSRVLADEII